MPLGCISDPVGEILVRMNKKRQQIVNKLVSIGIVEDRKLLRKPRSRKRQEEEDEDDAEAPVHIGANDGKTHIRKCVTSSK